MITNDVLNSITTWTEWAGKPENNRYDIALLKIWIQFEKFIGDLFVTYSTGQQSEKGFSPNLKLRFVDEEQLNIFLREGNHTYVDYPAQIKKLSKHIFSNDPFDVLFADATTYTAYNQIVSIRNYIAHESGEAKIKMIKTCFGGNESHFKEPNDYLLTKERSTNSTYYTYYTNIIKNATLLLVDPPQ